MIKNIICNVKYCLVLTFTALLMLCSCSTLEEPAMSHTYQQPLDDVEYTAFLTRLDSLNKAYPSPDLTRGEGRTVTAVTLADTAGGIVGPQVGRWVGMTLGSLTGNPLIAFAGAVIGKKAGQVLGGALASGIAAEFLSSRRGAPGYGLTTHEYDTNIHTYIDPQLDSIGYFHNKAMLRISTIQNNSVTRLRLEGVYDNICSTLKEDGFGDPFFNEPDTRKAVLYQFELLAQDADMYINGTYTTGELVEIYSTKIEELNNLPKGSAKIYRQVIAPIAFRCANMDEKDIHQYAIKLNQILQTSNMEKNQKDEIAAAANLCVNSALCWQHSSLR